MSQKDELLRQAVADYGVPSAHAVGLVDYKLYGRVPNEHLMKIIENDLFGAMRTVEVGEQAAVYNICVWLAMELPKEAYGSSTKMWRWVNQGGLRAD